jgi:hypothetical protein
MMVSSQNHAYLLRVAAYTDVDVKGENTVGNRARSYEFFELYRVDDRAEIATEQGFRVYEYTISRLIEGKSCNLKISIWILCFFY